MSHPIENSPFSSPVQKYPEYFQALLKDDEQPPLFKQMNLESIQVKKIATKFVFPFQDLCSSSSAFCTTC